MYVTKSSFSFAQADICLQARCVDAVASLILSSNMLQSYCGRTHKTRLEEGLASGYVTRSDSAGTSIEHILFQGVGIAFGPDVTKRWCEANGVTGVIRSHEVRQGKRQAFSIRAHPSTLYIDGYAIEHDGLCTTVSLPSAISIVVILTTRL